MGGGRVRPARGIENNRRLVAAGGHDSLTARRVMGAGIASVGGNDPDVEAAYVIRPRGAREAGEPRKSAPLDRIWASAERRVRDPFGAE